MACSTSRCRAARDVELGVCSLIIVICRWVCRWQTSRLPQKNDRHDVTSLPTAACKTPGTLYCCTSAAVACNRRLASFPNFVREARVLVAVLLHDPRDAASSGKGAPFTAATYHVALVTSSSHKKCVARKWLVQWMATPSLCLRRGRLCSGDAATTWCHVAGNKRRATIKMCCVQRELPRSANASKQPRSASASKQPRSANASKQQRGNA